jgi:hypothetical protein
MSFPSHTFWGKLPLIPAGDHGTIPRSMHGHKDAYYPRGVCDRRAVPCSTSTRGPFGPLTIRLLPAEKRWK